MDATIYRTDGTSERLVLQSKERLEQLQKLVGGLIEIIHLIELDAPEEEQGNDLVINEEGLILDLPVNPWSRFLTKRTIWENQKFRGDIVHVNGILK